MPQTILQAAVSEHAQAVYNLAFRVTRNRADAEDVTQEAFAALAREAGGIRDAGAVRTWLLRTALRECWKITGRERRRKQAEREAGAMREGQEEGAGIQALVPAVSEALDRLPEGLKLPLVLRYFQKLSYAEIGEVLGCPAGSVSGKLREGQEALRKALPSALGLVAVATLEEALGAVPPLPLPVSLGLSLEAMGRGSVTIANIVMGGLMMSFRSKAGLGIVALLLLLIGGSGFIQAHLRSSPPPPADVSSRATPHAEPVQAAPEGAVTGIQPGKEAPPLPMPASEPQAAPAPATAEILVKVRDPQGAPVQGVEVRCGFSGKRGDGPFEQLKQRSDARGEAMVSVPAHLLGLRYGLTGGLQHLEKREEGDAPWGRFYVDVRQAPLGPGERREHEVVVEPALLLCVDVHGSDYRPVEGRLHLDVPSGRNVRGYTMLLLPSHHLWLADPLGQEDWLQVRSTTHRDTAKLPILSFPRTGNRIEARITLDPAARIEGQVVMADASPCRKGVITYWPEDDPEPGLMHNKSVPLDGEGRFSIGGLSSEVPFYVLQVESSSVWEKGVAPPKRVKAAPGQRLLITLEEGQSISGQVLDVHGAPVEDARIFTRGSDGRSYSMALRTDKEGRFEITGLPKGDFRVRVFQAGIQSFSDHPDGCLRITIHGEEKTLSPVGWEKVPAGTHGLEIVLRDGDGMKPYR